MRAGFFVPKNVKTGVKTYFLNINMQKNRPTYLLYSPTYKFCR